MIPDLIKYKNIIENINPIKINGKVTQVVGLVIEGHGPGTSIGGLCHIYPPHESQPIDAEVVGFREGKILLMPLGDTRGITPGSKIVSEGRLATIGVGRDLLGRIIDGLGNPLDGKPPPLTDQEYPIYHEPINPLHRKRITEPLDVGIRVINSMLTCGKGQRVGIFSGSGVGKSILLGMMAKKTTAEVNVIGLIGERGREVREFIDKCLGSEGLSRSVVVAATSDQPPLIRIRGAFIAITIAEYFRDQGKDVIFMMDSITRFSMALREVGLAIGEPPASKGYTPSVFTTLPKILERSGTHDKPGSITGMYTILVERDDIHDPIGDAVMAILDGHIVLSRELAARNHYPAIDVLNSISRSMIDIVPPSQMDSTKKILTLLSDYREAEDLINIGAYVAGSNPKIDQAIKMNDRINDFLQQGIEETYPLTESVAQMETLLNQ